MKRGDIIQNVTVEKLVFWGKGFAKTDEGKTLFITGWAVPWSILDVKIIKKKSGYLEGQIVNIVKKSPIEKKHPNNLISLYSLLVTSL